MEGIDCIYKYIASVTLLLLISALLVFPTPYVNSLEGNNLIALDEVKIDQATEFIRNQFQTNQIIGGAIGIVHKDKLVRSEGFGVTDKTSGMEPSSRTIYSIASITKALTATAVLQLHSKGLLDIDQPVITYIPWFGFANKSMSDQLTIRHLLIHAAGGVGSFQTDAITFKSDQAKNSTESYARLLNTITMPSSPGGAGNYCNGCYDVLGLLIEYVSGMSYYDYMEQNIFKPLRMENTVFGHDLHTIDSQLVAKEYSWFFSTKQHIERSYESFGMSQDPDGGAYSTIEDLGSYLSFLLGYSNVSLLDSSAMEMIKTEGVPTETNSAIYTVGGFEAKQLHGTDVYYKTGDGIGSATAVMFIPKYELGIALLMGEFRPEIQQQLIENMASLLIGHKPIPIEVTMTLGQVISLIAWLLVGIGGVLLTVLIWRIYKKSYTVRLWRAIVGLVMYGAGSFFLWYLLLTVRPSPASFYGYPYDLAIGLVFVLIMLHVWVVYDVYVIWRRRLILRLLSVLPIE